MGVSNEVPVDVRLEGYWQSIDDDKDEANVRIWVFNEYEYYVEWEMEEEGPEVMRLRAFSTEVNEMLFANMVCVGCGDDEPEWFFFRYELESPDILVLQGVRDEHYRGHMTEMTSIREIRDYVESQSSQADFFEDEIARFRRVERIEGEE